MREQTNHSKGVYRTYLKEREQENYNKSKAQPPVFSGYQMRFYFALLILTCYFFFGLHYRQDIKQYITRDYTKNVFDFISKLEYTLDYEKISFK